MAGSLGEKLGDGSMADVHAWAPGQVIKLYRAGIPGRICRWEAHMTRAVFAAGGSAPEVLDEVKVEGRRGMVLPRLEGPTLAQLVLTDAISPHEAGAILARLALSVHQTPTPAEVFSLRDYMEISLRLPDVAMPEIIAGGVLALIDQLPQDDRLAPVSYTHLTLPTNREV